MHVSRDSSELTWQKKKNRPRDLIRPPLLFALLREQMKTTETGQLDFSFKRLSTNIRRTLQKQNTIGPTNREVWINREQNVIAIITARALQPIVNTTKKQEINLTNPKKKTRGLALYNKIYPWNLDHWSFQPTLVLVSKLTLVAKSLPGSTC